MKLQVALLLLSIGALLTSCPIAADTNARIAYGVDSNVDSLYTIDLKTGAIAIIGALGSDPERYTTPISLAIRRTDGAMFASNNSPDMDRGISRLNPATGKATLVVPYDGAIQSISFNARDQLIAQLQNTGRLAVIDLETGNVRQFGSYDLPILNSLATDPNDGQMFGLSEISPTLEHLYRISSAGEIISSVDVTHYPPYGGGPMAFDASGSLFYIASGGLFQIDPATGRHLSARIPITFPYLPQGFALSDSAQMAVPALSKPGLLALVLGLLGATFLSRSIARELFLRGGA